MAKVKDQVYDGSGEAYIDAAGDIHFFGEFYRQTLTDSYPLPSLNPVGVVRKSPRVRRDQAKGKGTPKQSPWRECFQQCADRWNEMPLEDPDCGTCPQTTSRARVWAAKQAQGVMCSYWDLYMACCLSYCTQISITGPGGITFKGGTIPPDDNCWPVPSPCKDSELSIAYTTSQMCNNGAQVLQAYDSVLGLDICCCPTGEFSWEIVSGDGALEPDSGPSIIYTAPDGNPNCDGNPTIRVTDCCGRTAEVTLAVSNCNLLPAALTCCNIHIETFDYLCRKYIMCDGSLSTDEDNPQCAPCEYHGQTQAHHCEFFGYPPMEDVRTEEVKAMGCCPFQLL